MRWKILVAAAGVTTACLFPSDPVDQLELAVTLSAVHVHADSGLHGWVTAINPHSRTVHLEGGCLLGYELVPPLGHSEHLRHSGPACAAPEGLTFDIAPGDSMTLAIREAFWPQYWNQQELVRWPAGHYQVVGFLIGEHGLRRAAPVDFDLVCTDPTWSEC